MSKLVVLLFVAVTLSLAHPGFGGALEVSVETLKPNPDGETIVKGGSYEAHVTLYVENGDSLTPAGWSTRKNEGGNGKPFKFSPGVGLIQGWTDGVLRMKVGERAKIHVPAHLGYGDKEMGRKGGAWYIPANSNLCFDIEVLQDKAKAEL